MAGCRSPQTSHSRTSHAVLAYRVLPTGDIPISRGIPSKPSSPPIVDKRQSQPIQPNASSPLVGELYIHKPLGFSYFPKELLPVPESWVRKTGNLVYFKQHTEVRPLACLIQAHNTLLQGGHFAALERPRDFKEDLAEFVSKVWPGVSE